MPPPSVVVLGAGPSGLAAARALTLSRAFAGNRGGTRGGTPTEGVVVLERGGSTGGWTSSERSTKQDAASS